MTALTIDRLYRAHHAPLNRVLARRFPNVAAQSVEDAVQFAWVQLLDQPEGSIDERVFCWLYVVAFREILRNVQRHGAREVELVESATEVSTDGDLDDAIHARNTLTALTRRLPRRQLQALGYQAIGLSYAETADVTGWSLRTVERQTLRGRQSARLAVAA